VAASYHADSWASSPQARARMQAQRARDTAPELAVRRLLHRAGLRYRINYAPLPHIRSRADIVFLRARVAVFIDGCFWHSCPLHASQPKSNEERWARKLARNRERDAQTNQLLSDAGWLPIRIWEHQDASAVVDDLITIIQGRCTLCTHQSRLLQVDVADGG
jgi:DNA mismatch endonuclease, patch repair protein